MFVAIAEIICKVDKQRAIYTSIQLFIDLQRGCCQFFLIFLSVQGQVRECGRGETDITWWCFKTKETKLPKSSMQYTSQLLPKCASPSYIWWLSLLHFHQLGSFVEDSNAAITMFSFLKGSTQPLKDLYLGYLAIVLQTRKSLEILSSYELKILEDTQFFSSCDSLSGRGKFFTIGLLRYFPIPILA